MTELLEVVVPDGSVELLEVVVPDGSVPGQTLLVQTADRQAVTVVIPSGLTAGDKFSIASPGAASSSSSIVRAVEQGGRVDTTEQKLTHELQEIKAHTMHKMLETLDTSTNGILRLLYLTGDQAELIATSPSSLEKMLSVLIDEDAPRPQVLISLLRSGGFREYTMSQKKGTIDRLASGSYAGVKHGRPPFLSREEEDEAALRLDRFMADVLIPLAAQNHAIVLCEATTVDCALSSSFTRMLSMADAKWQGRRPFTVISTTEKLQFLYQNQGDKTYWRKVRKGSKTWTRRDEELQKKLKEQGKQLDECMHDLDSNATCLLLVEPVPTSLPYSRLTNELERHLCAQMPSLAIKTGFTRKNKFGNHAADTLSYAADVTLSGVPLLALDLRRRPKLHSLWRSSGVLDRLGDVRKLSEAVATAATADDEGEAAAEVDNGWMPRATALPAPTTPAATPTTPPTAPTPTATRQRSGPPSFRKSHTRQIFDASLMSRAWADRSERDLRAAAAEQLQPSSSFASRQQAIDFAKEAFGRSADLLLDRDLAETFDVCTLAFFHEALFGDGSPRSGTLDEQEHVPLFLAIAHAYHLQDEGGQAVEDLIKGSAGAAMYNGHRGLAAASSSQVAEVALWVTKRYFKDAWAVLPQERQEQLKEELRKEDAEALKESEEQQSVYREVWREDFPAMLAASRTLLSSPNFYHLNLLDSTSEQARKQVLRLVQLDRLPRANPLVGLLLLRDAWKDYDVAVEMAGRYKRWCKRLFLLQLALSWLVVVASTFGRVDAAASAGAAADADADADAEAALVTSAEEGEAAPTATTAAATVFTDNVVFVLALLATFVGGVDAMLNAKARWRHLRRCTGTLETIIWKYRTRTGPFMADEIRQRSGGGGASSSAEKVLCTIINDWRERLVVGAAMATTNLEQRRARGTYRHGQDPPADEHEEEEEEEDNGVDGGGGGGDLGGAATFGTPAKMSRAARGPLSSRIAELRGRLVGTPPHQRYNAPAEPGARVEAPAAGAGAVEGAVEDLGPCERCLGGLRRGAASVLDGAMSLLDGGGDDDDDADIFAAAEDDDHHSPSPPEKYIRLRILPMLEFYRRRIPQYTWRAGAFKLALLLLGVASSLLAKFGLLAPVTVVSSLAAAATSHAEFSDTERKVERYTHASRALKQLLSVWSSLGTVEKSSPAWASRLVNSAEQIISEEREAWSSTAENSVVAERAAQQRSKDGGGGGGGGGSGKDAAGAAKRGGGGAGGEARNGGYDRLSDAYTA